MVDKQYACSIQGCSKYEQFMNISCITVTTVSEFYRMIDRFIKKKKIIINPRSLQVSTHVPTRVADTNLDGFVFI
jgi:hypothetical protein